MKFAFLKILTVTVLLIAMFNVCNSAPTKTLGRTLADNYTTLTEDFKWFFRGINKIASTMDQMLPNVTTEMTKTRSFSENTRVTLLMGLHHFLVGVREIAMTFEKSFNTDHVKQLYQLKYVASSLGDVINALKMWFNKIRALVMHLLLLYNRYIPEVLFGKCLGNYLVTTYPERSFYEYPFILLSEIYSSIIESIKSEPEATTELSTELPIFDPDLNMEQNEILSSSDLEDFKSPYARQLDVNATETSTNFDSFFDFRNVLSSNKDQIIENAATQQSWQICLKLYTAESISRSLKIYFLGI